MFATISMTVPFRPAQPNEQKKRKRRDEEDGQVNNKDDETVEGKLFFLAKTYSSARPAKRARTVPSKQAEASSGSDNSKVKAKRQQRPQKVLIINNAAKDI